MSLCFRFHFRDSSLGHSNVGDKEYGIPEGPYRLVVEIHYKCTNSVSDEVFPLQTFFTISVVEVVKNH